MNDKEFHYEIDPNFDFTIEEKGNVFLALRKIYWNGKEEAKLDLRKYISTENGERMQKGVSFLSEEGPNELINVLMKNNYGNPTDIADIVVDKRKDIFDAISKRVNGVFPISADDINTDNEEELYDTRRLFEEDDE